jgi:hypothetical protein
VARKVDLFERTALPIVCRFLYTKDFNMVFVETSRIGYNIHNGDGAAGYPYEPNCKFVLQDLVANQTLPVAQDTSWGWFLGWSPDSQWMLFSNSTGYFNNETNQKYSFVNTQTRIGKWVILPVKSHGSTAWASKSNVIAYSGCEGDETAPEENCQIQFWGPDGTQIKQPIPLDRPFSILSWLQDDIRLLLRERDSTLWIINVDGGGLQPILGGVPYPKVMSNDGP